MKKNDKNATACQKRGLLGRFFISTGKVLGIVGLVCCVISLISMPFAKAELDKEFTSDNYTIVEFCPASNMVIMENADGVCEIAPLGVVLKPDADFSKYIGMEVYLKRDAKMGDTREDGLLQRHIIVLHTEHVLQLDMMVDGVASGTGLQVGSSWYYMYRDCAAFGVYPES